MGIALSASVELIAEGQFGSHSAPPGDFVKILLLQQIAPSAPSVAGRRLRRSGITAPGVPSWKPITCSIRPFAS